jgi:hypothetical protein
MSETTKLATPVSFFIFNRPDLTSRVFEEIRNARPQKLFVVADGPRSNKPGEADLCAAARAVTERVDWPCEVERDYARENLGCRVRVSSGITRVFDRVPEAIILEDDCLPHPGFFPYCQELLAYYRDEQRVMTISGENSLGRMFGGASYYWSRYPYIWGWATWRRAWQLYDVSLKAWPDVRESGQLGRILGNRHIAAQWQRTFDDICSERIDTWDFQWIFAHLVNQGLTAASNRNLVSNIGIRADGTHTVDPNGNTRSNVPAQCPLLPIRHPASFTFDPRAARAAIGPIYGFRSSASLVRRGAKRLLKGFRQVVAHGKKPAGVS